VVSLVADRLVHIPPRIRCHHHPHDLTLDIEIEVVPEGYKTVFQDLCEDRLLKAKVFFRPHSPAQSHGKSK
jgi:hypothetical protein